MKELAKQYDPSQVEDRIYQFWLDGGYFHTKADPDKKPYTIVMPPPNVTGQLHMGHAVDNTMQDILIRTKRMQGYHGFGSVCIFHMKSCQKRTEPVQFYQKQWDMMQVEPVSCHISHLSSHRLKTAVRDQAFYLRRERMS